MGTLTIQRIVNSMRAHADLVPILGAPGFSQEPALTIANDVMQRFLAQPMDWKFNRANMAPILTVTYQQDYVTNTTNLSWMETGARVDINNTTTPKPFFGVEAVRDLPQTSAQTSPFSISWVPNSLAVMGSWQANTAYPCGYGRSATPASPIQQFIDANGNILFINSTSLGLSINSPGTPSSGSLSVGTPYGISGGAPPAAPANSAAGTAVVDGSVTWTVADPNGAALRLGSVPPQSGVVWLMCPVYQMKPPILTSLQSFLTPIPDEFGYLFRQGFIAYAYEHAGSRKAKDAYMQWEEALMIALRSGDRERDGYSLCPGEGIMGGGSVSSWLPLGPAYPFSPYGY